MGSRVEVDDGAGGLGYLGDGATLPEIEKAVADAGKLASFGITNIQLIRGVDEG